MDAKREMAQLMEQLERLEQLVAADASLWTAGASGVSKWSVGEQVDHTVKALETMLTAIHRIREGHESVGPDNRPTVPGRLILRGGSIPRGRAQSPEAVVPERTPDPSAVGTALLRARSLASDVEGYLDDIEGLSGTVPHPLLGDFSAAQWLRFVRIHTAHHLAIIDDILAPASNG